MGEFGCVEGLEEESEGCLEEGRREEGGGRSEVGRQEEKKGREGTWEVRRGRKIGMRRRTYMNSSLSSISSVHIGEVIR